MFTSQQLQAPLAIRQADIQPPPAISEADIQ